MIQQKQHRPNLDRALAIASGPVQFLASDGQPLDEGKWSDPLTMLQHAADIKAATISVPTPGGPPIRFGTSGQALETVRPAREADSGLSWTVSGEGTRMTTHGGGYEAVIEKQGFGNWQAKILFQGVPKWSDVFYDSTEALRQTDAQLARLLSGIRDARAASVPRGPGRPVREQVDPGPGYRLLAHGERLEVGDEAYTWADPETTRLGWVSIEPANVGGSAGEVYDPTRSVPIRRSLAASLGRPVAETTHHPAMGAMSANDYFGLRIGSPGVSGFLEWVERQTGHSPEMTQVKWTDFVRRYEGETGQAVYWESSRPVAEQSGSDLARELARAGDYLDNAVVVIRTVAGKAGGWPEARQQLEDLERSVGEGYVQLSKAVTNLTFLYLASARPTHEAVRLHRKDLQTLIISGSDEAEVSQWVDTFVGKIGGVGTRLGVGRYEVVVFDPVAANLDEFLPVGQSGGAAFVASAMAHTQEFVRPVRAAMAWTRERDPRLGWVYVIQQGPIEAIKWAERGRWWTEITNTATNILVDMFDDPDQKVVDDWVSANMPA